MTFIDASVILEVIEKRLYADICERFLGSNEDKAISTLTIDLVLYLVERDKIAWEPIKIFLDGFIWLPIIDTDAHWAFANFKGKNFEDALQVACAMREGCNKFATLDSALSKKYSKKIKIDLLPKNI